MALTAVFVGFGLVSSTSVKELTGSLVTIGSTLGGFFLTALAVLLGMSGTEFFDRIIQMKNKAKRKNMCLLRLNGLEIRGCLT